MAEKHGWISTAIAGAVICGVLSFGAVPRAYGDDDRGKCQHRIEKAEARLSEAIHDHGEHSAEAEKRRHELNDEREHCWQVNHAWYSAQDRQWHSDHDWDHDNHEDHH
jgi:hypothetical protein